MPFQPIIIQAPICVSNDNILNKVLNKVNGHLGWIWFMANTLNMCDLVVIDKAPLKGFYVSKDPHEGGA